MNIRSWALIIRLLFHICAPISSGVMLALAFPRYDQLWLVWIGLVPLLLVIVGMRPWRAFFASGLGGVVFFVGIFQWILAFPGFTFLHQAILGVYVGTFIGLFGLAFSFISRKCGVPWALLTTPFLWVPLEYIRSNLSFMALPWGCLGHSQYGYLPVIQIASVTGQHGVSFLIVMVNAALASILLFLRSKLKKTNPAFGPPVSGRGTLGVAVTAAILISLTVLYGHATVTTAVGGKGVKVSLVQGNIEQAKKWDPRYSKEIMQTYADLTKKVSGDQPELIIWPETATPRAINLDLGLYSYVRRISKEAGTYLLLGSSQQQKITKRGSKERKYLNSAFLIPPEDKAKHQKYDKIRLMPFGEYLPLKGVVPWSYFNVPDVGGYVAGEKFTIFETPAFHFGVTICWENLFPDLVRQFVRSGAQLIVNITNEAWFGKTDAPYQFVAMNVFRAVENRVYVVRCANTGISCVINDQGRIINRVTDQEGRDVFVRGVLTERVIPLNHDTFYTRHGDLLVWVSIVCSAVFLLMALLRNNPALPSGAKPLR
ncbi:MAG TPA: apolipoprotein N-acyltransferase [Acidobacteriota bacterium]|nr:apolipoprotein N-acyltransferase [Acidobacteriota bacterium]